MLNDINIINNSERALCGPKQEYASVLVPSVNSRRAAAWLLE